METSSDQVRAIHGLQTIIALKRSSTLVKNHELKSLFAFKSFDVHTHEPHHEDSRLIVFKHPRRSRTQIRQHGSNKPRTTDSTQNNPPSSMLHSQKPILSASHLSFDDSDTSDESDEEMLWLGDEGNCPFAPRVYTASAEVCARSQEAERKLSHELWLRARDSLTRSASKEPTQDLLDRKRRRGELSGPCPTTLPASSSKRASPSPSSASPSASSSTLAAQKTPHTSTSGHPLVSERVSQPASHKTSSSAADNEGAVETVARSTENTTNTAKSSMNESKSSKPDVEESKQTTSTSKVLPRRRYKNHWSRLCTPANPYGLSDKFMSRLWTLSEERAMRDIIVELYSRLRQEMAAAFDKDAVRLCKKLILEAEAHLNEIAPSCPSMNPQVLKERSDCLALADKFLSENEE